MRTTSVKLPISAKVERRERRMRWAGFALAYGGLVLTVVLAYLPLVWGVAVDDLGGKFETLAALQRQEAAAGGIEKLPPEVRAAEGAAEAAYIPVIRNCILWTFSAIQASAFIVLVGFFVATVVLDRAPIRSVKKIAPRAVREELATTFIAPEEIVDTLLYRYPRRWILPFLLAVIIAILLAVEAMQVMSGYLPYPSDRRGIPWEELRSYIWSSILGYKVFTPLLIYLAGFVMPLRFIVALRIAFRPRSASGLRDRLIFLIGEFGGLVCALVGFGSIIAVFGTLGIQGIAPDFGPLDDVDGFGRLRGLALFLISAGLLVYLVALHRRALRDQRRKAIEEVYRFE